MEKIIKQLLILLLFCSCSKEEIIVEISLKHDDVIYYCILWDECDHNGEFSIPVDSSITKYEMKGIIYPLQSIKMVIDDDTLILNSPVRIILNNVHNVLQGTIIKTDTTTSYIQFYGQLKLYGE